MIGIGFAYALAGAMFLAMAARTLADAAHPKRWGNAAFFALLAVSFWAGDRIGDTGNGLLALALVALAGTGCIGRGPVPTSAPEARAASAERHRNRLFLPALIVPAAAVLGTLLLKDSGLIDPKQVTLVSLALGVIVALGVLIAWLRPPAAAAVDEGRRLLEGVGWAAVLPQMLAALGAVFALAGIGEIVGRFAAGAIPEGSRLAAVAVYGLGMAGFTMLLGNAFAAFPVMTAAVGLPVLIRGMGADPAVVAAIGMLAGFCGTLMTPMAANFNLVPAALLELRDRNAVIRMQLPTALPLLFCNILLIWWFAFP
ncbi:DUF979 domain-containing protein [Sphingomonas jatrophae]|uniref:Uncharacterized membrane protein n=1 Tax=Sphingomonas jatrophae TaxID=1166337 RepID=A0A1I6JVU6_9SPHN|nr:DUF979 domain-containing protein [Sphingomonas jatrophae]SFR83114.1 Uncharacterized membrane protein [Sphingomonas jatrophae]